MLWAQKEKGVTAQTKGEWGKRGKKTTKNKHTHTNKHSQTLFEKMKQITHKKDKRGE